MLTAKQLAQIAEQASGDLLKNDFTEYFKSFAFSKLHPATKLIHTFAIDCMCEYAGALIKGEIDRLIINVPPGLMKSSIISAGLTSFYLGHFPSSRIGLVSNREDLVNRNIDWTRRIIEADLYSSMFPSFKIGAKDSMTHFRTTSGGEMHGFSSSGNVTGERFGLLCFDDYFSSKMIDRESTIKEGLKQFDSGFMSRLDVIKNKAVVTEQRLGTNDLTGYILRTQKEEWTHLILPAEFREKTYFYIGGKEKIFNEGDVLAPEIPTFTKLVERLKTRVVDEETGIANAQQIFWTQYMQNPIAEEGNLIKLEWLKEFDLEQKYNMQFDSVIVGTDAASKTKKTNDPSAFIKCGVIGNEVYVLDVYNKRKEYHETKQNLIVFASNFPIANNICIEDASTGQVLITELRRESKFGIVAMPTKGLSKEVRARNETGQMANGNVYLPKNATWLQEFKDQLMMFPNGKHDDMVDCFVYCLQYVRENQMINYDDLFSFF
jgi:predicted phage terminase large subunit-like protein